MSLVPLFLLTLDLVSNANLVGTPVSAYIIGEEVEGPEAIWLHHDENDLEALATGRIDH